MSASRIRRRPIARWSARCGRRATATTTIWRASNEWSAGGEDEDVERMSDPRRRPRRSARRLRPGGVGLGRGECRLGQDARAGAARDPAAAARHATRANILCLTYTKAAAANMANRVFETLGKWTALDDAALDEEIAKIEGRRPDTKRRAACAAAVRAGARHARRPEGADDPRVLHAAAASVSVRGGRRGALRGAGGAHAIRADRPAAHGSAAAGRRHSRRASSAARSRPRSRPRPT